jgi:hypothetical protein
VSTQWSETEEVFRAELHQPDMLAVRIVYSAIGAHYLPGAPVWLFDVAPPSSGKTEKLMPLKPAVGAHIISTITPQTFISGWTWRKSGKPDRDASLLTRIGPSGIVICKDFSQVLSMPRKQKGPILADLRDIYDGFISKSFGTGEDKSWSGRITFIAGATPDLDMHYMVFQTLGERFLQVRSNRPGGVQAALTAMRQSPRGLRGKLNDTVRELFVPIAAKTHTNPTISSEFELRIANLAELTVRARTHVPRDGRSREVIYMPQAEGSPRLAQQMIQLARGSALLDARTEVSAEDVALIERVAFDSIRADRRQILCSLKEQSPLSVAVLSKKAGLSAPGTSRRIEELRGLGILECEELEDARFESQSVRLSDLAQDLLAGVSDE